MVTESGAFDPTQFIIRAYDNIADFSPLGLSFLFTAARQYSTNGAPICSCKLVYFIVHVGARIRKCWPSAA